MKRPYDHESSDCDDSCDYDSCRIRYRRALGVGVDRDQRNAADSERENYSRALSAGTIYGKD